MRRAVPALFALVLLVPTAAQAGHITFGFSVATATTNAYSDITSSFGFGTTEMVAMTIDYPGWTFAHQAGTSPLSPVPQDGHTVGDGTATATWEPFCGLAPSNRTLTVKWEATIQASPSPPANTVSQLTITAGLLFNTQAFIVRNGPDDYSIVIPDMPDEFACNGKASSMTLTFHCSYTVGGTTYRFCRNPSSAGTYTPGLVGSDAGGTSHATSANSVAII